MKKLSIEEKAKAYDEALKVLHKYDGANIMFSQSLKEEMFPELKESEDERIRKAIKKALQVRCDGSRIISDEPVTLEEAIAWLEKQGEHQKFIDSIQIGDKVTRNEDGALVNLSQLKRVAKKDEKQGEQKPADKVEPKFKVGDWVVHDMSDGRKIIRQIINMTNKSYILDGEDFNTFYFNDLENDYHLWTIQDAKDGNVLATEPIKEYYQYSFVAIYKEHGLDFFNSYCFISFDGKFYGANTGHSIEKIHPATNEQRDLLFQKMKEAGYEWNAEKKELKKIENEEVNGEDYGIDSLWHAQRILEKTLGEVDGYQTDDGILEHKCAISAVKQLYEQKHTWSDEDISKIDRLIMYFKGKDNKEFTEWFSLLKDRVIPQPKQEWSEEDSYILEQAIKCVNNSGKLDVSTEEIEYWLKSLRPQNTWKPSDEQINALEKNVEYVNVSCTQPILKGLLENLKKLREE